MAWMLDGKAPPRKGEAGFLLQEPVVTGQGVGPTLPVSGCSLHALTFQDWPELTVWTTAGEGPGPACPALYKLVLTISHLCLLQL